MLGVGLPRKVDHYPGVPPPLPRSVPKRPLGPHTHDRDGPARADLLGRSRVDGGLVVAVTAGSVIGGARCAVHAWRYLPAILALTVRKSRISPGPTTYALRFLLGDAAPKLLELATERANGRSERHAATNEDPLPRRPPLTRRPIITTSCRAPCRSVPSYPSASTRVHAFLGTRSGVAVLTWPRDQRAREHLAANRASLPVPRSFDRDPTGGGATAGPAPLRASHVEIHHRLLWLTRAASEQRAVAGRPTLDDQAGCNSATRRSRFRSTIAPFVTPLVAYYCYPVATTAFVAASADGGSPMAVRLWQLIHA